MGGWNGPCLAGLLLLLMLPAGCGFAPAYRPASERATAGENAPLAQLPVRVQASPALADLLSREGADMGLLLLPPGREADAEAAVLVVSRREERYGLRSDRAATRAAVRIAGRLLFPDAQAEGSAAIPLVAVVPYDILRSDYATEIARRDALVRASRLLLEQLRGAIARWQAERSRGQR
ncbi:MAG: hypothetical protein D6740_01270 [Alphaproteobacteria bacterium]|nr:MAG: hypothetical protein D6740_01270 [Alphaproteobacteria bacterium]